MTAAAAAVVPAVVVVAVADVDEALFADVSVLPLVLELDAAGWPFVAKAPLLPLFTAWLEADADGAPPAPLPLVVLLFKIDEVGVVADAFTAAEAAATPARVAAADVVVLDEDEAAPACKLPDPLEDA